MVRCLRVRNLFGIWSVLLFVRGVGELSGLGWGFGYRFYYLILGSSLCVRILFVLPFLLVTSYVSIDSIHLSLYTYVVVGWMAQSR